MKKFTLKDILTFRNVLDTKKKYTFIWSVIFQIPALSLLAGAPLTFDYQAFQVDEITAQLIETLSYTLGIIGTISVGIFSIKRNNDDKHKENKTLVESLEDRQCKLIEKKFSELLTKIDDKSKEQINISDEKFKNIHTILNHLREKDKDIGRKIDRVESKIFNINLDYLDRYYDSDVGENQK